MPYVEKKSAGADFSVSNLNSSLDQTLRTLQREQLDLLFLHEPSIDLIADLNAVAEWVIEQKKVGKVRWVGLSGRSQDCLVIDHLLPRVFDVLQIECRSGSQNFHLTTSFDRKPQITFGHIRNAPDLMAGMPRIIENALVANVDGVILVGCKSRAHLNQIVSIVNELEANLDK